MCGTSALGGLLVGAAPSGTPAADAVLTAAFAALLAAAGATARPWTWLVVAGLATAMAGDAVAACLGGAALVVALVALRSPRPPAWAGAAVGGLAAQALLRGTDLGFQGASALAVGLAVAPLLLSAYRHAGRPTQVRVRWLAGGVTVAVVLATGLYGASLARARSPVDRGMDGLYAGLAAARQGDEVQAAQELDDAADEFRHASRALGSWWVAPARVVPVLGPNARATEAMADTATTIAREAARAADDADTDRLTVQGGRLDLASVRALGRPLDEVSAALRSAAARIDGVRAPWLAGPVARRLDVLAREIAAARPDIDLAADVTRVLPEMLGAHGTARWFVAFVTPTEARGRTGFIGNYAELTATDGQVAMTRFGRTQELEQSGVPGLERRLSGPDDYLARWGRFEPAVAWRNITMSPDFPSVGRVITELYPQSGGRPVDGVIALDPAALAALLHFTGPIAVPGVARPLTAENATRFLLRDQYLELRDTPTRIDALESLARATFDRLTTGDLPGPRAVADRLGEAAAAGHLHLFSPHPAQQRIFRRIGLDGALPRVDGDFLAVVNNNATGNKVDLFLQRDIDYHATWDPASGDLTAEITVTLTNQAPHEGLPDYVIGSALPATARPPPGTNRTHLSVYSPWGLDEVLLDGGPAMVESQRERGRAAYSLLLDIPPDGGHRTVLLRLVGHLPPRDQYRLDVTTQPLVNADRLTASVEVMGRSRLRPSPPMTLDGRTATATARLTAEETAYQVGLD